ncbi:MAG: FAD-dependent oxidoreductase, partial [Planctomycetota bacterium]
TPFASLDRFPVLTQVECRQTQTTAASHELIRANLHRAPMFTGQIEGVGPRYCPSIEDKVVRFAQRDSHAVFLEPESLDDDWIYCNGISTSLPAEVQTAIVRSMPGCERAEILRFGYAVEYDMVRPHQILPTGMTRLVHGLFLAGQINGTSGYEEAAAQGLVAGVNAARLAIGEAEFTLGRDQAYIGVLMDDLVTKTPVEPYRMFTSRAEYRLLLRADNAADRLTPIAGSLGLLTGTLGSMRRARFAERRALSARLDRAIDSGRHAGMSIDKAIRTPQWEVADFGRWLTSVDPDLATSARAHRMLETAHANRKYAPFVERALLEIRRQAQTEHRGIPDDMPYDSIQALRTEARVALSRFRPRTFGQAGRLEGITPADLTLLSVLVKKHRQGGPTDERLPH